MSLRGCDQYLRSSISGFSQDPSPSGNSTLPVALRFGSKSTRAMNLDISTRGKRFLKSEKALAFAASERCLASGEEFIHFHSALLSLAFIMMHIYFNFKLFLYSKMVLLTIVTNSNPHTLYFDHPIEKPSYMYIRLLSASLYNSWNNLKEEAAIEVTDPNRTARANLLPGHYTINALVNEFNNLNKNNPKFALSAIANTPVSSMTIFTQKNMTFTNNLLKLLGIKIVSLITFVKRLNSPTTYFVHCDLIDKRQNLLNGKPSTVLAKFDIRGQPFERVHYQTPQQQVLRDSLTGDYDVNSLTISVSDEKGNLFDFNDQPLEFELEIN